MKFLVVALLLQYAVTANDINAERIADAIYVIEGGKKTKYPYGIKSINTKGNVIVARKICINTINNTHKRWIAANKPNDFLDFLADRYCPSTCDKQGNKNWKANIRKLIETK